MIKEKTKSNRIFTVILQSLRALQMDVRARGAVMPSFSDILDLALNYTSRSALVSALAKMPNPPTPEGATQSTKLSLSVLRKLRAIQMDVKATSGDQPTVNAVIFVALDNTDRETLVAALADAFRYPTSEDLMNSLAKVKSKRRTRRSATS